jgi:uncharacterized protein (UPF0548 family)
VICLRRPSDDVLKRVLDDERAMPFPYPGVGATAHDSDMSGWPAGFRHDRFVTDLGPDDGDRFRRAGQALLQWAPQRGAGIRVFPGDPVAAGEAFVLALRFPGAGWAVAPGRVVYLLDEPDRVGFAYGTLPGHPERGEEAFVVARDGGRLRFEVLAFSRPHDSLARLGRPVARALQVRTLQQYLRTMEAVAT